MEGHSVPDLEQMDANKAVSLGKSIMTTRRTNTPRRMG